MWAGIENTLGTNGEGQETRIPRIIKGRVRVGDPSGRTRACGAARASAESGSAMGHATAVDKEGLGRWGRGGEIDQCMGKRHNPEVGKVAWGCQISVGLYAPRKT